MIERNIGELNRHETREPGVPNPWEHSNLQIKGAKLWGGTGKDNLLQDIKEQTRDDVYDPTVIRHRVARFSTNARTSKSRREFESERERPSTSQITSPGSTKIDHGPNITQPTTRPTKS